MRKLIGLLVVSVCTVWAGVANSAAIFNPNNGHYYERVDDYSINWTQAKTASEQMTFMGVPGYLATITTDDENWWIIENLGGPSTMDHFLGGFYDGNEWKWVTGEQWNYTNWWSDPGSQEPSGDGPFLEFDNNSGNSGYWNDIADVSRSGYIVEFDVNPVSVRSFSVAGIIDGSNSYSTTVDGITMTIDNPSPNSLSLFEGQSLNFGEVAGLAVTLLSFDVSFDSRVWLTSLDQLGSIGTVNFSIVGNGVTSYENTITGYFPGSSEPGEPPGELPFVGGPLQLQPGDRYTFSAVTGGSDLDGLLIASFNTVGAPACTQEDYVLLTQAEVDAFPQDCNSVEGSIDIVSSADITNVDSLSNVTSVGGYLKIKYNDALINLDGLSGLASVGGYLKIKYNNALTNCQGIAPVLGWPSGPPNDSVGGGISIFSNGGTECDSVAAILASVSGPTQPVINTATGRDQSISLAFSPSITPDVLFPISDYEAVCSGLTEIETAQGVGSPLSVGNLTNYREYDCTVAPVTRLGTLPLSSSVSAIAGAVPPSPPQITSIDPGSAEVSINVSVANDGGSPIRFYDAYCLDDSNIYQGSSLTSPITVSGLTPGETYICLATATNDVGTSSLSAFSAAVIPEGPADTDADGVPDLIDNCVSIPNADQEPSFVPGCGAACVTSSCAGTFCENH